jgi:hypothetical protein
MKHCWKLSPACEEDCAEAETLIRDWCHCQYCGETGIELNQEGFCHLCQWKYEVGQDETVLGLEEWTKQQKASVCEQCGKVH